MPVFIPVVLKDLVQKITGNRADRGHLTGETRDERPALLVRFALHLFQQLRVELPKQFPEFFVKSRN